MANFLETIRTAFKLTHTQSVPKSNTSAINIPINSAENYVYTAPSAGYVCAYYEGVSDTGAIFLGHNVPGMLSTTAMSSVVSRNNGWIATWIRVRKGDSIVIWVDYNQASTGFTRFIPDEGA